MKKNKGQVDFKNPIDINEFMKLDFPEMKSFWGKGLLDPCSKLLITGLGKLGKSNFVLNLAICLAKGMPFLGFQIPCKKKVLYIQQEMSIWALRVRLDLMLKKVSPIDDGFISVQTIRRFDICRKKYFSRLESWILEQGYEVVIFDPFYTFHSKDENVAHEMKKVVSKFEKLIVTYKISVIILHHHNKGKLNQQQTSYLIRGSTVLFDWGDSYIMLNPYKNNRNEMKVDWQLRNAESPDSIVIERDENLWHKVIISEEDKKMLAIYAFIKKEKRVQQKDLQLIVKEKLNMKGSTLRNYLNKMKFKDLITDENDGHNKFWLIADNTSKAS